jgi:hypothetical protein
VDTVPGGSLMARNGGRSTVATDDEQLPWLLRIPASKCTRQ